MICSKPNQLNNHILCLLLLLSTSSFCQLKLGAIFGINYSNVNTKLVPFDGFQYNYAYSFRGGFQLNYHIENWKLTSGILLSERATKISHYLGGENVSQYFGFIEFPLLISRNIYSNKLQLGFGIVNAFMGSTPIHLIGENKYEIDLKTLIYWNINENFGLEASYLYGGVNNVIDNSETYLFSVFNISLCYSFLNILKGTEKK